MLKLFFSKHYWVDLVSDSGCLLYVRGNKKLGMTSIKCRKLSTTLWTSSGSSDGTEIDVVTGGSKENKDLR